MRILDRLRADHPDPGAEKTLTLAVATKEQQDGTGDEDAIRVDYLVVEGHEPPPGIAAEPPEIDVEVAGGTLRLEISGDLSTAAPELCARRLARVSPLVDVDLLRVDLLRTETWYGVLAALMGQTDSPEVSIAFSIGDEARLVTWFHAAIAWLGLRDGRLRSARLELSEAAAADRRMTAAFTREKERHLHLDQIDLASFEWLAPEHRYAELAEPAWAYANGPSRPDSLSVRQLYALRLYTTEFYQIYHQALRGGRGDDPGYRQLLPLIDCMDAGLENLPARPGRTFRGEWNDTERAASRRALEVGSELDELSYLSSSVDELHAAAMRRGFLFRIAGHEGRDISMLSEYPWEREVLFGRGLRQRVLVKDCSERSIAEECDFDTEEATPTSRVARRRVYS